MYIYIYIYTYIKSDHSWESNRLANDKEVVGSSLTRFVLPL